MRSRPLVHSLPRNANVRCFHCGDAARTRDHVPPRSFLVKPRPQRGTTLPSCAECNRKLGDDEHYLLRLIARASGHRSLRKHVPRKSRKKVERIDWTPVRRVVAKLVIGLYFRRYNVQLSLSEIREIEAGPQAEVNAILRHPLVVDARGRAKRWESIQSRVFEFIFVNHPTSANQLRCLINLFGVIAAGATCPRPTASRIGRFDNEPSLFD